MDEKLKKLAFIAYGAGKESKEEIHGNSFSKHALFGQGISKSEIDKLVSEKKLIQVGDNEYRLADSYILDVSYDNTLENILKYLNDGNIDEAFKWLEAACGYRRNRNDLRVIVLFFSSLINFDRKNYKKGNPLFDCAGLTNSNYRQQFLMKNVDEYLPLILDGNYSQVYRKIDADKHPDIYNKIIKQLISLLYEKERVTVDAVCELLDKGDFSKLGNFILLSLTTVGITIILFIKISDTFIDVSIELIFSCS